uniref:RUN domain-containing protein n=1 Tax=Anopheles coluzzii TaxID=1518534 RepID=A0A8W7PZD5_ANOCL
MVGMSSFGLNASTLESIVGGSRAAAGTDQEPERNHERQALLNELLATVRQCQQQYGGHAKLATEDDPLIGTLCDVWERVLSHGLRTAAWMPFNILEYFGPPEGGRPAVERPCFWDFASNHLTRDERERFCALQQVVTRRGRARALLRAFLNERALERYVLVWLGDGELLNTHYEPWAMLRHGECQSVLPNVAAGLGTVLFAIVIDRSELNRPVTGLAGQEQKPEPIIVTRRPVGPVRKVNAVQREILDDAVPRQLTPPSTSSSSRRTPLEGTDATAGGAAPREEVPYTVTEALGGWGAGEADGPDPGTSASPAGTVDVAEDSMLNYSSASATTSSRSTTGSSLSGEGRGTEEDTGSENADLVEQRRQRLQVYLNGLFVSTLPEVLSCSTRVQLEQTFPFLSDQTPVGPATPGGAA